MTSSAPEAEGRGPGSEPGGDGFTARGGWHIVAFFAAMALVLTMSIDWYTTEVGEERRRVEDVNRNAQGSQRDSERAEQAAQAAEDEEKTAWQADAFVDRLILLALLAAFAAAVAAAFMRSAGRRPDPPWNPSAIATVAGVVGTLLVLYRMIQPPGLNDAAVLKVGAPLGLVSVGILTVASRLATLTEKEERAVASGKAVEPPPSEPREPRRRGLRRRRAEEPEGAAEPPAGPGVAPPAPEPPVEESDAEEAAREARRRAREEARGDRGDVPSAAEPELDEREVMEFELDGPPEPERHEEPLWATDDLGAAEPGEPDVQVVEEPPAPPAPEELVEEPDEEPLEEPGEPPVQADEHDEAEFGPPDPSARMPEESTDPEPLSAPPGLPEEYEHRVEWIEVEDEEAEIEIVDAEVVEDDEAAPDDDAEAPPDADDADDDEAPPDPGRGP